MRTISTKKKFAKRIGRSVRHLERLIAVGEGPPIIKLGPRAVGIDDDESPVKNATFGLAWGSMSFRGGLALGWERLGRW